MDTGTENGEIPTLGVGMLGYAFMGKAHSNAFKTLDYIYTPPPAHPSLVAIGGSNQQQVEAAARRYGYAKGVTDWRDIVERPGDSGLRQLRAQHPALRADDGRHSGWQARPL